ncbi:MAG: ComEA family DNA-binding protein [Moraxella sp.]|nr:ComEA family DNA-binding protein [Moraxella sp.]
MTKPIHGVLLMAWGLALALLPTNAQSVYQCYADVHTAYAALLAQEPSTKSTVININTATVAELTTLKGVGQTTATAIVEYRQAFGQFRSIDELTKVKGIGKTTVDNNRHRLGVW